MKTWAPSESKNWLNENLERYEENAELRTWSGIKKTSASFLLGFRCKI
jgi:hypothetical protein